MSNRDDLTQSSAEPGAASSKRRYPSRRGTRPQQRSRSGAKTVQLEQLQVPEPPAEVSDYWEDGENHASHTSAAAPTAKAGRTHRRRYRRKRKTMTTVVVLIVILGLAIGLFISIRSLGGFSALVSSGEDYQGEGSGIVYVDIPKGASGQKIGKILEEQDVIKSADTFASVFKKNSLAQGVQAGRFEMRKHMSAKAALARLLDPQARADRKVTIPEGFTLEQLKERLVKTNGFDREEVEQALSNPQDYGITASGAHAFEGWLAPESYTIDKDTKVKDLIKKMVETQIKRLDTAGVPKDQREDILIRASILEREVNQDRYYGKVARVIVNRMADQSETRGRLQMDSTVLYGVGKVGGIPSKADLENDNPYNTYKVKGLPPTPIGMPGVKAIAAAFKPEAGNWVYFVTVNLDNGDTKFAATNKEHTENVAEFRAWCAKPENKKKCSS